MMLKRFASLSLSVSLVGYLAACTGDVSLGQTPQASTPGAADGTDGSTATGPWGITCTTWSRPAGTTAELVPQKFTARSDAKVHQTITYADAAVDFDLAPASDALETETILTVTTPTQQSTQAYRLSRGRRPAAQFAGDHGFTGLVYVGGSDLQYVCEADGSTPPARQAEVVPLDVVCQVELRSAPGGAVEKRDSVSFKADGTGNGPSPDGQSLDYEGDVAFTVSGYDDAYDGRSVSVGFYRDPMIPGGTGGVHQLFQLDRNSALLNQLAGTTFSGRVAITTPSNKELSYACSARNAVAGCPAVSDVGCNPGCTEVRAATYDGARSCRSAQNVVVSCNGPATQTLDLACLVRSDGLVVYGSSSLLFTKTFTPCDNALGQKAINAPTCASGPSSLNACAKPDGQQSTCSACPSGEMCFTQVTCNSATEPKCTVGSSAPASDNACHKSCTKNEDCPGSQCVQRTFFGCSDADTTRGICE